MQESKKMVALVFAFWALISLISVGAYNFFSTEWVSETACKDRVLDQMYTTRSDYLQIGYVNGYYDSIIGENPRYNIGLKVE